jgi:hypothetical protein
LVDRDGKEIKPSDHVYPRVVYKYELTLANKQIIKTPLTFDQKQWPFPVYIGHDLQGKPCIWIECPAMNLNEQEGEGAVAIYAVWTGHDIPRDGNRHARHLATILHNDLVWHLYTL